jgi:hypothetical protein
MPRLIDDIRVRGVQMPVFVAPEWEAQWLKYAKSVMQVLTEPKLPVLLIDNVADYYYVGTGQEYWSLERDFPNLAPPYECFWAEHRLTRRIHSDTKGDTDMSSVLGKEARLGAVFMAIDPQDAQGKDIPENARWLYWADIFIQYDHVHGERAHGPHGAILFAVDAEGHILGAPQMQNYAPAGSDEVMKSLMTWLHPALLAICFLHCKNVTVTDESVPKPLARKHHARTGQWPTAYKTLVIEPLKQILRHEGRSGEVGLAKAMHICRGHFRDYREGKGLFGKYKQLVWTPMTVRGTRGKDAPAREIEIKV